jgi:hypothetical protein
MACSFVAANPSGLGVNTIPTYYVDPTNALSFSASGAFKTGAVNTCQFYQGSKKNAATTYTGVVKPYITWGSFPRKTTATCSPLSASPVQHNQYTTYKELECDVAWTNLANGPGTYTLTWDLTSAGVQAIATDVFVVKPAKTETDVNWEVYTKYTTLPAEPASTTTLSVATETLTDTAYVDPTPSSTVTESPFKTTETAWLTITPPAYGTTTM